MYVNKRAGELFGRRPEDLVGKHIWTEFPEGVGQTFYQAYHRAVAEQVFVQLEDYYLPWDRWSSRTGSTPRRAASRSSFPQDITVRKRAEALVEEAARRSEAETTRRSEGGLGDPRRLQLCRLRHDLEGRYIVVNAVIERLVGRDRAELIGRDYEEIFGRTNEIGRSAERDAASGDLKVTTEEVFERIRPRTYLVERLLHGDDGAVVAVGGIATDITERVETEWRFAREGQLAEAQRAAHVGSFEWDMRADRAGLERRALPDLRTRSRLVRRDVRDVHRAHPSRGLERVAASIEQAIAARACFAWKSASCARAARSATSTWGEVFWRIPTTGADPPRGHLPRRHRVATAARARRGASRRERGADRKPRSRPGARASTRSCASCRRSVRGSRS